MKYRIPQKFAYLLATALGVVSLVALPVSAETSTSAATTTTGTDHGSTTTTNTTPSSTKASAAAAKEAAASQARLQRIIDRGNLEIDRRLDTLKALSTKISAATKLTASDAATLNATVNGDISSLTTLKTKLDADTTVTAAITDAESIITSYRVFVLVVPQVNFIKAADDQQVGEGKLATLSTKLSTRITAEQQKGTNVTALLASLTDLNSKVAAAQTISSSIESGVITLVPSNYNTNHSILSGDRLQLETAQNDIKSAITDAQSIVTQLTAPTTSTKSTP